MTAALNTNTLFNFKCIFFRMKSNLSHSYLQRFDGNSRIFSAAALPLLQQASFCIVGIGGVGSWAAESTVRSGIGNITLIDHDDIDIGNSNRQIHTLVDTIGQSKVETLRRRILSINPECECIALDELVTRSRLDRFQFEQFDFVIDAIDHVQHKTALVHHCRRNKTRLISTGGAGGLTDPTKIDTADLTKTFNDPLLAKVRANLRQQLGYSRNPRRSFGIPCVYSTQQPIYPTDDGNISYRKPARPEQTSLDCATGIGSFVAVTASFGFCAAAFAVNKYLEKKL